MPRTFLGVETGGTKIQVAVGTAQAKILETRKFTVAAAEGAEGIRRQIEQAVPELVATWKPSAGAIGFGGPLDRAAGCVALSHQIQGWSEFPLRDWFSSIAGVPTLIENDANIAGLGEAHHGAGQGLNPVFYVTLGSGVGGGLVIDGLIYHGATPGEAELGHVRLDRQGTTVESRCSGWAMDARIREWCRDHENSSLAQLVARQPGAEARHLSAALAAGDSGAARLLRELAADLAFGLSHVTHLFHPRVVILGGGLSAIGEPLRASVAAALTEQVMDVFKPGPEIRLTALREQAVPVGCMAACRLAFPDSEAS